MAIDTSIGLFCAASCSQLNASKSQAFLVQSQPPASATFSAMPSISFITGQQTSKHLGVRLGYDMPAACIQTFSSIHQAIRAKVRHWSARGSFLGRVHVAKQVLAASMWYHATFQRPPEQLLQQISRQLSHYVASAQHHSHSAAAVALALFSRVLTSSLPPAQGGVGLVEVPTQIQALQAKVLSRLLEPERLAWKVFQLHHLCNAPQAQQLAARQSGYVTAFRAWHPHRLLPLHGMSAEAVLNEPPFFNQHVSLPDSAASGSSGNTAGKLLTPQDQPLLLTSSITKAAHSATASTTPLSMPPVSVAHPREPDRSAPLTQHSASTLTGTSSAYHCYWPCPCHPLGSVRTLGGPSRPSAQSSAALYSQGPLWGPARLSLGVWGWGQQPARKLVVREASQRLRLIQAQRCKALAPGALVCRPRLLPLPGSDQSPTEVLQELESRWAASIQSISASRPSPNTDMSDSQPAWMAPQRVPRLHWSQRQQRLQTQQQQQPA